jgi:hypothetical protein
MIGSASFRGHSVSHCKGNYFWQIIRNCTNFFIYRHKNFFKKLCELRFLSIFASLFKNYLNKPT